MSSPCDCGVGGVWEQTAEGNIWIWNEVAVKWRKLHYDGLHNVYFSSTDYPKSLETYVADVQWRAAVSRSATADVIRKIQNSMKFCSQTCLEIEAGYIEQIL
jgi:hypothetical protein